MILAVGLSVAIGVSLGLLGGGGSILTVPILVYVVGLETKSAIATSLFVVGVTSLTAMVAHARAGRVRWGVGAAFGAASMVGAYAGGRFAHILPGSALLAGFTAIMAVTGVMMLRPRPEMAHARDAPLLRTALVGVLVGALTGLVGAGGGFVVVPALVMLGGLPIAEAIATSLFVIAMNSFAGLVGATAHVHVDVRVAAIVTIAAVAGSFAGALASGRVRPDLLRRGFAILVLAMAALMTYRQIPHSVRVLFAADPRLTLLVASAPVPLGESFALSSEHRAENPSGTTVTMWAPLSALPPTPPRPSAAEKRARLPPNGTSRPRDAHGRACPTDHRRYIVLFAPQPEVPAVTSTTFTPWSSLLGGALIGASASVLLMLNGRIAGISGIVGGLVRPKAGEISWRAMFVIGLLLGGVMTYAMRPASFGVPAVPLPLAVVAGLLVGFGTRLGSGCTSGHGVCGLSRFSRRSLAATLTFIATGGIATFVVRHAVGATQ